MSKWLVSSLGLALVAACGGGTGPHDLNDALPASDASSVCNVLTQTGCPADERCTWVRSTDPSSTSPGLGAIACAPKGTIAIGGACTTAKVAMGGTDDCVGGSVCVTGTCKSICDNNGGAPGCSTNQACVTYDGLFANSGSTTVPAGVCDPSCNPLDDNDFDGSGTLHAKSGSACGSDPMVGCYGEPSSAHTTYFTCAPPAAGTGALTHRSAVAASLRFLNSCMPGYELGQLADAQGSMQLDCYAWCKPSETYFGNPSAATQAPNGAPPHRCNNTDALGDFSGGTPTGSSTSNGEHCMFSWWFELDHASAIRHSPTSDTLGICIDHTRYQYDANGDSTPDTVWPPCAALPVKAATVNSLGASDLGCVTSTTAGLPSALHGARRLQLGIVAPEFPRLSVSSPRQ